MEKKPNVGGQAVKLLLMLGRLTVLQTSILF